MHVYSEGAKALSCIDCVAAATGLLLTPSSISSDLPIMAVNLSASATHSLVGYSSYQRQCARHGRAHARCPLFRASAAIREAASVTEHTDNSDEIWEAFAANVSGARQQHWECHGCSFVLATVSMACPRYMSDVLHV